MKISILGPIAALAIAFAAGPALGADPSQPPSAAPAAPPPAKACTFPAEASIQLNVKDGTADVLLKLMNNPDAVTRGDMKLIGLAVSQQIAELQTKYCK